MSVAEQLARAPFELRGYQREALASVFRAWKEFDRVLGVAPTGSGKGLLLAAIIQAAQRIDPRPALILSHTDELLQQLVDKVIWVTGIKPSLEKAESRAELEAAIVVASIQTLSREHRLQRFPREHFGIIIADEAHRSISVSWSRVLNHFFNTRVLGVTATPDRGDARSLGEFYQQIAFEISLLDLIRDGYLCPAKVQTVPLAIDISNVSVRAGDFKDEDIAAVLDPILEEIAQAICQHAAGRKSLIFLPLIDTADRFARILRDRGLKAEMVCGVSQDRQAIIQKFRSGETRILCNSMLLTEGFDEATVDCVVCLRPTQLRHLYCQVIGRGFRTAPGKDHLLILDFLWHSERHALVKPASLIAKTEQEAAEITEALARSADGDLIEAQESAKEAREQRLKRELEEQRRRKGELLDIFEVAARYKAPEIVDFDPYLGWHHLPVTEAQIKVLEKYGVVRGLIKTRGQASVTIDAIFQYNATLPATAKQLGYMRFLGNREAYSRPWTKQEAARWIAARKSQLEIA